MEPRVNGQRVLGLDAVRFVAALWVVLSHVGTIPLFSDVPRTDPIGFFVHGAKGIIHSGPAAVVVFFVVSGFCIHVGYAGGRAFRTSEFLVRRYVRIGIPMLAATFLSHWVGEDLAVYFQAILWSLAAELIYYTLYVPIRRMRARLPVDQMLLGSYALALLALAANPHAKTFGSFGWELTWVVGLPCWLLGVRLADAWCVLRSGPRHCLDAPAIWKWRLWVLMVSSTCVALNFHSPIGHPWTLIFFALLAYAWLLREIQRANSLKKPWPILEWAGTWSYSIYLCHMLADRAYSRAGLAPDFGPVADWLVRIAAILAMSYVFYVLVERPAHLLARWAGRSFSAGDHP